MCIRGFEGIPTYVKVCIKGYTPACICEGMHAKVCIFITPDAAHL